MKFVFFFLFGLSNALGQNTPPAYGAPNLRTTIAELVHPESVLVDGNSVWVTDMGADTSEVKNGDGRLFRYSLNGKKDFSFSTKTALNSPMGMAQTQNVLFVADVDRVVGFHKKSGKQIAEYDLSKSGTTFLNDLTIAQDHLIVSATDIKKIYIISLKTHLIRELRLELTGYAPNGLFYDSQSGLLYVAANEVHNLGPEGNGKVLLFAINNQGAKKLKELSLGKFLDGVCVSDKNLVVSDWYSRSSEGKLYLINKHTLTLQSVLSMQTSGLADIDCSPQARVLATPDFISGKVRLYQY